MSQDITMTETEETALDLLPCPFCGGAAEIIDINGGENEGGSCVSCTKCEASSHLEFGRKENFVSCWNTRAALSRAPEASREEAEHWWSSLCSEFGDDHGVNTWSRIGPEKQAKAARAAAHFLAALSPPSTGGEGEAVAWCTGHCFTFYADTAAVWRDSGLEVRPLYLHPSPEMGEISREEIARIIMGFLMCQDDESWPIHDDGSPFDIADAILSKLKENGLSREELGGLARSQPGAAGPSDCAENDAQNSDGGRV